MRLSALLIVTLFAVLSSPPVFAGDAGTDGSEAESRELKAGDRDPEFLARVNECVRKGAEHLLELQGEDGNFECSKRGLNSVPYSKGFPGGVSSLVLLSLLKSGINRHDEKITKGFDWLRNDQLEGEKYDPNAWGTNYVASVTIMALEARHEPPTPVIKTELTSSRGAPKVKMPQKDFLWMTRCVKFIEATMISSNQEQFVRGATEKAVSGPDVWNYPGSVPTADPRSATIRDTVRWPDHSNTQYALLGLKAAFRCGVRFETQTLKAMANVTEHFIKYQQDPDPSRQKVARLTMLEDSKHGYVSYKTVSRVLDEPRGWKYIGCPNDQLGSGWQITVTGSMTTAGIASLLISSSIAKQTGQLPPAVASAASKSAWDAIAWLAVNFTVTKNPGGDGGWHYYFLYGLERAAVLAGVRNIGTHDWYREGAEFLMARQARDGSWQGDAVETCFALLFLTRATTPMGGVVTR